MTLIIDGHNLIPKIPGISLADENDEQQLLALISEYCRLTRNHAEVFFDGAPPPQRLPGGGGLVHAHYVRKGTAADDAIIAFVEKSGKNAKNQTVVSSDRHIQAQVRAFGSAVVSSETFAAKVIRKFRESPAAKTKDEPSLSDEEVNRWMEIFRAGRGQNS